MPYRDSVGVTGNRNYKTQPKEIMKPKKYKVNNWYNKKTNEFQFGIDVVMTDKQIFHCSEDNKPIFYKLRSDATKEVKRLNAELKQNSLDYLDTPIDKLTREGFIKNINEP